MAKLSPVEYICWVLSSLLGPSKGLSWCLAKTCTPALLASREERRWSALSYSWEARAQSRTAGGTVGNEGWRLDKLLCAKLPIQQPLHPRECTSRTATGKSWGPPLIPDLHSTTFKSTGRQHPGAGHTDLLEMFLLIWVRIRGRSKSKRETEQAADVSLRWGTNKKHADKKRHFCVQQRN